MKSKKVLITAVVAVIFLTALLFVIVFSMQGARAEQAMPMEEAAEEVPAETAAEDPAEPAEIPDKAAEGEEQPAPEEVPEETEAQPEDVSMGDEAAAEVEAEEPAEEEYVEGEVKIGCYTQSQKKVTPKEAAMPNWEGKEPSAADIPKEQAIQIAEDAAKEIFGLKNPKWGAIGFEKDMTGQRGDFWDVQFGEDELIIRIDALSGKVTYAYSEDRRSDDEETKTHRSVNDPFHKTDSQIWTEEETAQGGEYTAATRAIVEKYIDGKVEKYMLNAVHDAGKCYPLVSIDVLMEDGTVYEFEWARCGKDGELKVCWMEAFPSWDHFRAWANWDVDLILNGGDPV